MGFIPRDWANESWSFSFFGVRHGTFGRQARHAGAETTFQQIAATRSRRFRAGRVEN
jgi:hypothetical protein